MQVITKPAKKKLSRKRKQQLDVFFSPKSVAVIGATENPGTVGRTVLWNLVTSPFGGTVYPVNPKRSSVLGVKAYPSISDIPEQVDLAVIITPPASIPGLVRECGENGVQGAIVISAGFKEVGAEGAELERQLLEEAQKANIRIIGPELPRRDEPALRHERHLRHDRGAPRVGRLHQPERRPVHRGAGLEPEGNGGFQRLRLGRLDGGRGLGRPDLLPGQRSQDQVDRDLHGIHRQRALLPFGGARGGAHQADHRHQAGPLGGGGQSSGLAHRLAHRQRRGAGSRLPAQRRAARQQHRRPVLHGGSAFQAAQPQGSAPHHRDQCGRSRRAGHRRADHGRRRTRRTHPGNHGGLQRRPARHLEPQQPGRYHRRRFPRALRQGARNRRQGPQLRRHAGDPHAAGHDRPHAHRRAAQAARPPGAQARAGQLDGRRGRGRRRGDPQPRQHPHLPLSRYRRARLQLHVAVCRQPEGHVRDAGPAGGFRHLDAGPQPGRKDRRRRAQPPAATF